MTTPAIDATAPIATRFDTRETEDGTELRIFAKRVKIGAFGTDDIAREDWEDALAEFIAAAPRTYSEIEFWLTNEDADEEEYEEDREPGSIVPEKYRVIYGAAQNCGDDVAEVLTAHVTTGRANKKNPDGGLDRAALRGVAEVNGIADKLAGWEDRSLNGGLLRMNTANVLRGMVRRGERVQIGGTVWPANPELMAARIEHRKAARKAKKGA